MIHHSAVFHIIGSGVIPSPTLLSFAPSHTILSTSLHPHLPPRILFPSHSQAPLAAWRQQAMAVQTAVELLANVCSTDECADADDGDAGWDEDTDGDQMSASGASGASAASGSGASGAAGAEAAAAAALAAVDVPPPFRVALEAGVLQKLLARCTPAPLGMRLID